MLDMPRKRLPYLHHEKNRHGVRVWYFRRGNGPRIRLCAPYDSAEFKAEYDAALRGETASPIKVSANTLRWAIDLYRHSSAWASLSNATRRQRENIFRQIIATAGNDPLSASNEQAIREGQERRALTPHAANNFLKTMRGLFQWAAKQKIVVTDPTIGLALLRGPNDQIGFHTWTEAELERFEATWPIGTRERLAFDLLLYTGLRRGDAVRVGRQHVRDGLITIRAEKTGDELFLPILPPLAESIAATQTGDLAFLVTTHGEPWVKESFGNWFGEVCRAAGCPGSAHGLRKAGATRAAERGATENQLMALYGWDSPRMAAHYTRAASKKRLAAVTAGMLLSERETNSIPPHLKSGAANKAKRPSKSSG